MVAYELVEQNRDTHGLGRCADLQITLNLAKDVVFRQRPGEKGIGARYDVYITRERVKAPSAQEIWYNRKAKTSEDVADWIDHELNWMTAVKDQKLPSEVRVVMQGSRARDGWNVCFVN